MDLPLEESAFVCALWCLERVGMDVYTFVTQEYSPSTFSITVSRFSPDATHPLQVPTQAHQFDVSSMVYRYFLNYADAVAAASTCLRLRFCFYADSCTSGKSRSQAFKIGVPHWQSGGACASNEPGTTAYKLLDPATLSEELIDFWNC